MGQVTYTSPDWGDISGSSPSNNITIGNGSTHIAWPYTNKTEVALQFCKENDQGLYSYTEGGTEPVTIYYNVGGSIWSDGAYQPVYSEIVCIEGGDSVSTTTTEGTTTIVTMYNGPSYMEWLFVMGVIIFLLSFPFWKQISFTKESS